MKKKFRTENGGFTLIEVVLSITILALISVPLMKYFSDSLRYYVQTQEKQNATLAAQQTLEFIKSQDRVMKYQGALNAAGETIMHYDMTDAIKEYFGEATNLTMEQLASLHPALDSVNGKGTVVYEYSFAPASYSKGFDMRVTMETATGATEVAKPVVYGIDDRYNVVAAESNEEDLAIMEFLTKNASAVIKKNGGYIIGVTPDPTSTPDIYEADDPEETTEEEEESPYDDVEEMTEEEIRENLRRTVVVEMDKRKEILEGGETVFYTVKVYYEYHCTGVEGSEESVYTTAPLVDTSVSQLQGLYLMFNKIHQTEDQFLFKWIGTAGNPTAAEYPEIRLICQNITEEEEEAEGEGADPTEAYVPVVKFENFTGWTEYHATFRTNLASPNTIALDMSSDLADKTGPTVDPLTDSGNPVRVFKVTVQVFRKGETTTPLIEMVTSKTE